MSPTIENRLPIGVLDWDLEVPPAPSMGGAISPPHTPPGPGVATHAETPTSRGLFDRSPQPPVVPDPQRWLSASGAEVVPVVSAGLPQTTATRLRTASPTLKKPYTTSPMGLESHSVGASQEIALHLGDTHGDPALVEVSAFLRSLPVRSVPLAAAAESLAGLSGRDPVPLTAARELIHALSEQIVADAFRERGFDPFEVAARILLRALRSEVPTNSALFTINDLVRFLGTDGESLRSMLAYSCFDLDLDRAERQANWQYLKAAGFLLSRQRAPYPSRFDDDAAVQTDFDHGLQRLTEPAHRIQLVDALLFGQDSPELTALGKKLSREPARFFELLQRAPQTLSAAATASLCFLISAAQYFGPIGKTDWFGYRVVRDRGVSEHAFDDLDSLLQKIIKRHPERDAVVELVWRAQRSVAARMTGVPETPLSREEIRRRLPPVTSRSDLGWRLPPFELPLGLGWQLESGAGFRWLEELFDLQNPYAKGQTVDPGVGTQARQWHQAQTESHDRWASTSRPIEAVNRELAELDVTGLSVRAVDFGQRPFSFIHGTSQKRADCLPVGRPVADGHVRFCNPGQVPVLYGVELGSGLFEGKSYDQYLFLTVSSGTGIVADLELTGEDTVQILTNLIEKLGLASRDEMDIRWLTHQVECSYGNTQYDDYQTNFLLQELTQILRDRFGLPLDALRFRRTAPDDNDHAVFWTYFLPGPVLDRARVAGVRKGEIGYRQFWSNPASGTGGYCPLRLFAHELVEIEDGATLNERVVQLPNLLQQLHQDLGPERFAELLAKDGHYLTDFFAARMDDEDQLHPLAVVWRQVLAQYPQLATGPAT